MISFPSLKCAVQSKGRLKDDSLTFFQTLGLEFESNDRDLITPCRNQPVDFLFLRNDDIPEYVSRGVCDFGIVGENVLEEKSVQVRVLSKLGFGRCSLILAVPNEGRIKTLSELEGARIATSYPVTLERYLRQKGISAAIISLRGSVEIAPHLNLADAICDITQTGRTLKENGLNVLDKVLDSEAVLIESPFERSTKSLFYSLI